MKAHVYRVLFWLAALFAVLPACSSLKTTDAQRARVERFECQVRAVEPLVGNVLDAEQLVRDVYVGKADMGAALGAVKATPAEVKTLVEALQACEPAVELPAGDPS